jgi:hypothetical protein
MSKEGFTWSERLIRKYGGVDEKLTSFIWNTWSIEERLEFFKEFPVKDPETIGKQMILTRQQLLTKQWHEMSKLEQQSITEMYSVWNGFGTKLTRPHPSDKKIVQKCC